MSIHAPDLVVPPTNDPTIYTPARMSDGARKVLNDLAPHDKKKIRECPALSYSKTMAQEWKTTPQTIDLALMLAGIIRDGADEVTVGNFITTMKARWPALDHRFLKNVRDAVKVILNSDKRAAAKGDDKNVVNEDDFKELCDYALRTLERDHKHAPTLFHRDSEWVEVRDGKIVVLDRDTFAARLNVATFWRTRLGDSDNFRYVSAPSDVVNQVYAHPAKPVPPLTRVVTAPVFTAEGELVITPGYHNSGIFYAPPEGLKVTRPPRHITEEELAKARETLVDVLCDFEMDGVSRVDLEAAVLRGEGERRWNVGGVPTAVPPSFLSAVGFMLEQIARPMIDGPIMPLLISKTAPRAGGGLLTAVMQTVIRGATGVRPLAANEDERRKAILAALSSGTSVIAWDNLPERRTVNSPTLATLFTEGVFADRELGRSRERELAVQASFVMVGNRPPFTRELVQRLTLLELVPQTADPANRTGWKHESLLTYVKTNRGAILSALLVVVKNWLDRGRPTPKAVTARLGRFEEYRDVIGGILEAASPHWTSWQSNRHRLEEAALDGEEDGWTDLIEVWAAQGTGLCHKLEGADLADLASAKKISLNVARIPGGEEFEYNTRSFGMALQSMLGRIFKVGGLEVSLCRHDKRGNNGYPWYLSPVKKAADAADTPVQAAAAVEAPKTERARRRLSPAERAARFA